MMNEAKEKSNVVRCVVDYVFFQRSFSRRVCTMLCKSRFDLVEFAGVLLLTIGVASFASATTILTDNFDDNSLDGSKWTIVTGTLGASAIGAAVAETNQRMALTNHGYLVTANQYDPDSASVGGLTITGQWTTDHTDDMLTVATRATGVVGGEWQQYGEMSNGLIFRFGPSGNNARIEVLSSDPSITGTATTGSLTLIAGTTYAFTVIDNGTSGLSFTVTDTADSANTATITATLASDSTTSNFVVFYNREHPDYTNYYKASLDNVTISSNLVPEPSALLMTVFGLIGLVAYAWRERK